VKPSDLKQSNGNLTGQTSGKAWGGEAEIKENLEKKRTAAVGGTDLNVRGRGRGRIIDTSLQDREGK